MRTLDDARALTEAYLPGLLSKLAQQPLARLESRESNAIAIFKAAGGPGLLIPKAYSGLAASPLDAVRVSRALGASAPSLAVATTMHHFSMATLFTLAESIKNSGMEWALLEGIASQNLLMSSAFAEGRPGYGILKPTMTATSRDGGYVVNGSKKPCSLSKSMDFMSASVAIEGAESASPLSIALIPADSDGLSVREFWTSEILAGAESEEVHLDNVFLDERLIMQTEVTSSGELDELQTVGLIWFEMLIASSYLGMASALVEKVFKSEKSTHSERAEIGTKIEIAATLLDGIARMLDDDASDSTLSKALVSRYGAQQLIVEVADLCVEILGGVNFIKTPEIAYLATACRCLAFHPPSRTSSAEPLSNYFAGIAPLRIG